jgi:MYXO-CTERM domain-containing protein
MSFNEHAKTLRVRLPALLDDATTAEIGPELRRVAAHPANDLIVLDAADVRSICPAALGLLAAAGLIARRRRGQVEVVNCDPQFVGLLRVARLSAAVTDASTASPTSTDEDWTPWWRCAAANA